MSGRAAPAGYAWFGDDAAQFLMPPTAVDTGYVQLGKAVLLRRPRRRQPIEMQAWTVLSAVRRRSADYLRLDEGSHTDIGGGPGFDLFVADRDSTRFSGQAVMVLGAQWGRVSWLRAEISGGYRQVFAGEVGDTTANFADGNPFHPAVGSRPGGLGDHRFRAEDRNAVFLCGSRRQRRPARRRTALRPEDRRRVRCSEAARGPCRALRRPLVIL